MSTLKIPIGPEDHVQGSADAECTLVEYGDYECPHCGHADPIVKRLQRHLGKRLGFVFRNFPLRQIHPHAEAAAETAETAWWRSTRRRPSASSQPATAWSWTCHDL